MNRYLTGSVVWPAGWTKLRVYFIPRLDEIGPLAARYREVLRQFDFVSPIIDEWLHATVAVVQDRPAHAVARAERSLLESQLRQRLGRLPAFTVSAGGAVACRHGVLLDLTPDVEWVNLERNARSVVAEIFGDRANHYDGGRPHIALAYGTGPGDSGLVQSALRNATDLRVPLTVDNVRLVDVTQDAVRHEFRWRELALISLGKVS